MRNVFSTYHDDGCDYVTENIGTPEYVLRILLNRTRNHMSGIVCDRNIHEKKEMKQSNSIPTFEIESRS